MNILAMLVGHPGASSGVVIALAWVMVTALRGRTATRVAEVQRGVIRGRDGEIALVLVGDRVLQVVGGPLGLEPAISAPPQDLRPGEHSQEVGAAVRDRLQQHPADPLAPVRLLGAEGADRGAIGPAEHEARHLGGEAGGGATVSCQGETSSGRPGR
jgi:hypothetical protein